MATQVAKIEKFPINSKDVDCVEIEESAIRTLSVNDSRALLDALNSDIEPTKAAIEAFAHYKRTTVERGLRD